MSDDKKPEPGVQAYCDNCQLLLAHGGAEGEKDVREIARRHADANPTHEVAVIKDGRVVKAYLP